MAIEAVDLTLSDDDEEISSAHSESLLKSWGARPQPTKVEPAKSRSAIATPLGSAAVAAGLTPAARSGQVPRPTNGHHSAVHHPQDLVKKNTTGSTPPLRELAPRPVPRVGTPPFNRTSTSRPPIETLSISSTKPVVADQSSFHPTSGTRNDSIPVLTSKVLSASTPTILPPSRKMAIAASQPFPSSFGTAWNTPVPASASQVAPLPVNTPDVPPISRNVEPDVSRVATSGAFDAAIGAQKTKVTPQLHTFRTSSDTSLSTNLHGQSNLQSPLYHQNSAPVQWPGHMASAKVAGSSNAASHLKALSSQASASTTVTQSIMPRGTDRPQPFETPRPQQSGRKAPLAETRQILDPYFDCPVAQEMLVNPMPAYALHRMRKIFVSHPLTRVDMVAFLAQLGISKPGRLQVQPQTQTQANALPHPPPKVKAQAQTTTTPQQPTQDCVDGATKFILYTPPQASEGSVLQETNSTPHTFPRQVPRVFQQPPTSMQMQVDVTPISSGSSQVPARTIRPLPATSQAVGPSAQGLKRTADGTVKLPENASTPLYESTYYSKEGMSAASRLAQYGSDMDIQSRNVTTTGTSDPFAPKDPYSRDTTKDNRVRYLHSLITRSPDLSVQAKWASGPFEDELVDLLKQYVGLTWAELGKYFPYRNSWHSLQHRYSDRTIAKRIKASEASTPVPGSAPTYGQGSAFKSTASRHTSLLVSNTKTMSSDDESKSDAGLPRPRSKRAAVEAASKKGYAITRESFYGHTSDSEHSEIVPETSRIPARHHYVTCLEHEALIERQRFEEENARNSAAMAGSLERISRPPVVNIHTYTKRQTLRKRQSTEVLRPYLTKSERDYVGASNLTECNAAWCGKALHVDFTDIEVEILEPCITQVMLPQTADSIVQRDTSLRPWVAEVMSTANSADITEIYQRYMNSGMNLPGRSRISIESYLEDLAAKSTTHQPLAKRIDLAKPSRATAPRVSSSLRRRELGLTAHRLSTKPALLTSTLGPCRVFKKASSDVTNVAWAPNGDAFAVGSAALMDNHSMQYNRRNNLLFGDTTANIIGELPYHAIKRAALSGVNTTRAMSMSQDQLLYTSISAVKFAPNGTTLFTAGYDDVARIWDVRNGLPHLRYPQFRHTSALELLEVNASGSFFATGSRKTERSIQVLRATVDPPEDTHVVSVYESPKAKKYPEWQIMPSVLRWGPVSMGQEKYLVAGFSSTLRDSGGQGETCVWDIEVQKPLIETGSRSVFDIAWSPNIFGRLAIAGSPSGSVNKGTNSVVRIMDSWRLNQNSALHVKPQHVFELECPAIDINDVIFNAKDNNLITTGCTDGRVYLWDLRRPDDILHCFSHGKTLVELDQTSGQSVESLDTGIRFVSWDESGRKLFSGSSDGVVALWDPYVAPEDAHVRNIVQLGSGVMSGAFSPDFSNLLLGEEDGTVTMLSVGHEVDNCQPLKYNDIEKFKYKEAEQEDFDSLYDFLGIESASDDDDNNATAGIRAARTKLDTREIKVAPLAGFPRGQAVQGPYYRGPYNRDPDAELLKHQARRFQYQHRQRPEHMCKLEHEISFMTEEELGDDGTSKSRIPAHIRMQTGAQVICFRCNTAVLKPMSPLPDDDILGCHDCCMAWRVDVLGYTQVDYYTDEVLPQIDLKDLERITARLTLGQIVEEDHAAQDVEGWAHGLWGIGDEDE